MGLKSPPTAIVHQRNALATVSIEGQHFWLAVHLQCSITVPGHCTRNLRTLLGRLFQSGRTVSSSTFLSFQTKHPVAIIMRVFRPLISRMPERFIGTVRWLPRLFPPIFIAVVLGIVILGPHKVLHAFDALAAATPAQSSAGSPAQSTTIASSQPSGKTLPAPLTQDELKQGLADLKSREDGLKTREDEIKTHEEELKNREEELRWVLELILAFAGAFAIAQAAAAWFSSETFTKQAEDSVKNISRMEKELAANYPMYAADEQERRGAYRELTYYLQAGSGTDKDEGYDWRENLYENMKPRVRQKLLSVERLRGIESLRRPPEDATLTQNLRRLANFYVSKFQYERGYGFGYLGDLERAEYLLKSALDRSDEAFYLLNDLGLLHAHWYAQVYKSDREKYLSKGHSLFTRSSNIRPEQQRAYYNLGVIERRKNASPNWRAAIKIMQQAAEQAVWEEVFIEARKADIHYNLACWWARVAVEEHKGRLIGLDTDPIKDCLKALEECARTGLVKKNRVDEDYGPGTGSSPINGEFFDLTKHGNDELKEKLKEIKPRLYTPTLNSTAPQEHDVFAKVGKSLESLRKIWF